MGAANGNGVPALQMYGFDETPRLVPVGEVDACQSYRDAVRLCWALRRIKGMTMRTVGEMAGIHVPHVSDYLAERPKAVRNLPAERIADFEAICGNRAITQWLVRRSGLHLAEELMRAA